MIPAMPAFVRLLAVLMVLATVACRPAAPVYPYENEPDPRGEEFVLGAGDQIRVVVWRRDELSGSYEIPPNGFVKMPLIGSFMARGQTPSQLRAEIQGRLKNFIKDAAADVTINVTRISSYRFTVSGKVNRPNLYAPAPYVTVSEAIALAGGPTRFADLNGVYILRRQGGERRIPVDIDRILSGERADMNIVLLTGDTVVVP